MKNSKGKKITKKLIYSVLRSMDSTQIYRLVHIIQGGKVSPADVYTFIEENAPSQRVYNSAYRLSYNNKHREERIRIEGECISRNGFYIVQPRYRVVEYLKEQCKDPRSRYAKRPMYGHTHLYFCSPIYGHRDYNKWCAIPIRGNEKFCATVIRYADKFFAHIYDKGGE